MRSNKNSQGVPSKEKYQPRNPYAAQFEYNDLVHRLAVLKQQKSHRGRESMFISFDDRMNVTVKKSPAKPQKRTALSSSLGRTEKLNHSSIGPEYLKPVHIESYRKNSINILFKAYHVPSLLPMHNPSYKQRPLNRLKLGQKPI